MKALLTLLLASSVALASDAPQKASQSGDPALAVTPLNFARAESDMYFGAGVQQAGGTGKLFHRRELMPIERQDVVRSNRDTVYSNGIFDLDAGPVTIKLPEADERFMSLMILNQDHYVQDVKYKPGSYTYTREQIGTRYMMPIIRILVNPSAPEDLQKVQAVQDAVAVEQPGGPGKWEAPEWEPTSQKKVRDALLQLGETISGYKNAFGRKETVNPILHLIGTAGGWGGNPDKDAAYISVVPPANDGKAAYRLTIKDVPVDGFWSISLYNAEGYFEANALNAYSVNNLTAKKAEDGSVVVQFGECTDESVNCLPTMPGWNYLVRLYRPRPEILDGSWKFPDPQLVTSP